MKMTVRQWGIIIDTMKEAQKNAERYYEHAKAEYEANLEKDSKEFPDATDKELEHGLRHFKAVQDDWFHKSIELSQIIRILEETEI